MSKRKKIVILSCMIALLAITAVFNFILTGDALNKGNDQATVANASFFTQHRLNRASTRNEELLQLDAIITAADENSSEKAAAVALKLELTQMTENELLLETLIKANGFAECAVIIGAKSNNVNVTVKTAELTQVDAIKIYTIVSEEMDIGSGNVNITPIS